MNILRALARRHSRLAVLVVLVALALRIVVPGGFMPAFAQGGVTITICHGDGSSQSTIPVPVKTLPGASQTCAFADLDLPALGAVDPVLLAVALAFAIALGLAASAPLRLRAFARLRPPLRGPPARV
ncbi:MAG: hypothetical protein B7Z33_01370 [Sphingomonadales bacterium 12-68-11]|nr:MAG: hypothetical protein B7Z33_01370 [Sphingomonadales bacterium 12-68-11]